MSTRQRQLAVLTPSQLIELAYLSALLEQYPFNKSQPISTKVDNIRTFLELVVQVVPLESITYAMAYSPYKLAKFCTEILVESKINLPASGLMENGLHDALVYLEAGTLSAVSAADRVTLDKYPQLGFAERHSAVIQSPTGKMVQVSSMGIVGSEAIKSAEIPDDELIQRKYLEAVGVMNRLQSKSTLSNRLICEISIDHLYHISHSENQQKSLFKSPLDILREGKRTLTRLARELIDAKEKKTSNVMMLEKVNKIRAIDLAICTALLGGFMEQQKLEIPLVKSRLDQSLAFAVKGPASVGVWALSSLKYEDIHPILSRCRGEQLLVSIERYIKSISSQQFESKDKQYSAKLQFMVQGLENTVTYNSRYVSYSLERQLVEICKERSIDSETSLDELNKKWGGFFKQNILSLVARTYRSLVARWLKWALMVHSLREKLAEYTAVGVVGLTNSGKSRLVSSLFKIPVISAITHVHIIIESVDSKVGKSQILLRCNTLQMGEYLVLGTLSCILTTTIVFCG